MIVMHRKLSQYLAEFAGADAARRPLAMQPSIRSGKNADFTQDIELSVFPTGVEMSSVCQS
jgi:hypothetical protein